MGGVNQITPSLMTDKEIYMGMLMRRHRERREVVEPKVEQPVQVLVNEQVPVNEQEPAPKKGKKGN